MSKTNVLICDDSAFARKQMARAIPDGWDVLLHFAKDGQEALEMIRAGKGDVMFLDLNMPVMDGITFAFALKEEEGLKDIPLVMCTTENFESVRDDIKQLGIRAWMTKPITKKLLIMALQKILNG